jgi:hypothetical protein
VRVFAVLRKLVLFSRQIGGVAQPQVVAQPQAVVS